jgi:hypothetical protein
MTDPEFDKSLAQLRARWDTLYAAPPDDDDPEDYDPDLAFAEFFDELAGWDLETADFFLAHEEARQATKQ